MHRLLRFAALATLLLGAAGLSGTVEAATPPHPTDGTWENCSSCHAMASTAAKLRIEARRPTVTTNEQFAALRTFQDTVAEETTAITGRTPMFHPVRDVPCTSCHLYGGVGRTQHADLVINEDDPESSCGTTAGCHSLSRAMRMPFYVLPNVSLASSTGSVSSSTLNKVKSLVAYAKDFQADLANRVTGLPTTSGYTVNMEIFGAAVDYVISPNWVMSFEHLSSSPVPATAVTALAAESLSLVDAAKTQYGAENVTAAATFEGKTLRPMALARHLETFQAMPASLAAMVSATSAELRYTGNYLPDAAMTAIDAQVASRFPSAVKTRDDALRKEWDVDGNTAVTTDKITARITTGQSAYITFANLPVAQYPAAFALMDTVQQAYPDIPARHSLFSWTYSAKSAADKATLATETAAFNQKSADGDLKLQLTLTPGAAGTGEGSAEASTIVNPAQSLALLYPGQIHKLQSQVVFSSALAITSLQTQAVTTAFAGATDLNADGVVDRADYDAVKAVLGQAVTSGTSAADVNKDGKINAGDLRAVSAAFDCPLGVCK